MPVLDDATNPQVTLVRAAVPRAARADLPRHHAAVERQGDALDAVHRPELPLLVLVLEAGPVHGLQRLREGAAQGNIHFAGEHCSVNFQGFMEGGAAEGVRAASEIVSDLKLFK